MQTHPDGTPVKTRFRDRSGLWLGMTIGGVLLIVLAAAAFSIFHDPVTETVAACVDSTQDCRAPSSGGTEPTVTASAPPSTAAPSRSPTPTRKPATSAATGNTSSGAWPNPGNTGVPSGWKPRSTRTTNLVVSKAGAVVQDVRLVNADIEVRARNVIIRRVEIQGGSIYNNTSACSGLVIESVTIKRAPGQVTRFDDGPVISPGGYTARRVKVDGVPEGLRVGEKSRCGPVVVLDSFIRVSGPDVCGDWHGDGIQGYEGAALTVKHSTVEMTNMKAPPCEGTSPFFYPDQGNTRADIDGLLVGGGKYYAFRLGTPGSVRNLMLMRNGGGIEVDCGALSQFSGSTVRTDANYQPTVVGPLACGG